MTDVVHNIQHAFKRSPSFVLGVAMTPYIKEHKNVDGLVVLAISITAYLLLKLLIPLCDTSWILVWPVMILFLYALKYFDNGKIWLPATFMGGITLESFLTNTYVGYICRHYIGWENLGTIEYGHYLEYSVVILIGVSLAWLTNRLVITIRKVQQK